MIKGRTEIKEPQDIVVEVTIEMTIGEWIRLKAQMEESPKATQYESSQLSQIIGRLVHDIRRTFYASDADFKEAAE